MKVVFYDEISPDMIAVGCMDDDVALTLVDGAKRCGSVQKAEFVCGVSRFGDCAIVRVVKKRGRAMDDFVDCLRKGLAPDDIVLVGKHKIKDWYEI